GGHRCAAHLDDVPRRERRGVRAHTRAARRGATRGDDALQRWRGRVPPRRPRVGTVQPRGRRPAGGCTRGQGQAERSCSSRQVVRVPGRYVDAAESPDDVTAGELLLQLPGGDAEALQLVTSEGFVEHGSNLPATPAIALVSPA